MSKYTDTVAIITTMIVQSQGADVDTARMAATVIANALKDAHIISLPDPEVSTRTSVSVLLMAQLGRICQCKEGEDADDIAREAINTLGHLPCV